MAFPQDVLRLSELIADSLTGALIRTAAGFPRWELASPGNANKILGYTGNASEVTPATLSVVDGGTNIQTRLTAATWTGMAQAFLSITANAVRSIVSLAGDQVTISAVGFADFLLDAPNSIVQLRGPLTLKDAISGLAGGIIWPSGFKLRDVAVGSGTWTFTASATATTTVTHGLVGTPTIAIVMPRVTAANAVWLFGVANLGATTFDANARRETGAAVTTTVPFLWIALTIV